MFELSLERLEPFTILVTIGKPLSVLEAIRMRQDDPNWARRNKWTSSAFLGFCTFFADAVSHESHYPGAYVEAALTGIGAFVLSLVISYTPIGKHIDRLAEGFLHPDGSATDTAPSSPRKSSHSSSAA
jgi:hypothetical protein